MNEWHVVSFSGGKDSTAMLLHMLEIGMRVDEIIFCDTGVEFPQMYEHLDKVEKYIGRKITRLHDKHDFEWYLLHYSSPYITEKYGVIGKRWPDARVRWCTGIFKRDVTRRYLKNHENVILYVGIAADEIRRIKDKKYPLVEWGWTEKDALAYCYEKGFDWGGLYNIFKRVSCWCCPLQSLKELKKLRANFPDLWEKLLEWQLKTWRTYKPGYTVQALDDRFRIEEDAEKMQISLF